jgi:stress-induced morphogen
MASTDLLKEKITAEFAPTFLSVEDLSDGCGSKFKVHIVSDKFDGVSRLNRQRQVHASLGDVMSSIHAITLSCRTSAEEAARAAKNT